MGLKSTQNTRNVNQSNGRYEVDGLIFYSKFVYKNIKSIEKNLKLLYSTDPNSEKGYINHSNVRDDEKYFDEILGRVEDFIEKIRFIEDWYWYEICEEKKSSYFFKKFKGTYYCLKECKFLFDKYGCLYDEHGNVNNQYINNFERRIIEIKKELNYMGIEINIWGFKSLE